jgi:hypothetical protein
VEISVLAREELLLRDGDNWFRVRCAWGVDPGFAFLPSSGSWNAVVPSWLRDRRGWVEELITEFGLGVRDDDQAVGSYKFGSGPDPDPTKTSAPVTIDTLEPLPIHREPPRSS